MYLGIYTCVQVFTFLMSHWQLGALIFRKSVLTCSPEQGGRLERGGCAGRVATIPQLPGDLSPLIPVAPITSPSQAEEQHGRRLGGSPSPQAQVLLMVL